MNYEPLDIVTFGRQLVTTGDLDPMYIALYEAELDEPLLARWLIAYWCFYHAGVASRIAEAPNWADALEQAHREKWPRAAERRHFRGETSRKTVEWMRGRTWFGLWQECKGCCTFADVQTRVGAWPGFGPWAIFKAADMLERVAGVPIDFDMELDIYKEPAEAARMIDPNRTATEIARFVCKQMADLTAPPRHDRPLNAQEGETILCKWKSHVHGRYPMGKDSRELKHALSDEWGPLAKQLRAKLPQAQEVA